MGQITLHVAQTVNTEQLQHYTPKKHGLFQVHNCNTVHTGDSKDNNSHKTTTIIITIIILIVVVTTFVQGTYSYIPQTHHVSRVYSILFSCSAVTMCSTCIIITTIINCSVPITETHLNFIK